MQIDIESLRPCNAEILARCAQLIEHIKSATDRITFIKRISEVHEWQPQFGKSEMARWADVLNSCDLLLEEAVTQAPEEPMNIDKNGTLRSDVTTVLSFTALLFENTFTRSIYGSFPHLLKLLDTGNLEILAETLRLLQVMSKRSRFLSQHITEEQQRELILRLLSIAQPWSGKLRNVKMDECCYDKEACASSYLPITYQTEKATKVVRSVNLVKYFSVELKEVLGDDVVEDGERIALASRLRLVRSFLLSAKGRRLSVICRLLAVSILVYSRNLLEEWQLNSILSDPFLEETSRLLRLELPLGDPLVDLLKTEALKTLTSVISLDKPAKMAYVVDCLGANSYHGFMAQLARRCVNDLLSGNLGQPHHTSVQFCTALFSLLYHLAGFDSGGEALVSCALTETLLCVVSCHELPLEQVSFVTRAVRVVDIMTSLDASGFTACNGMNAIVSRLIYEVKQCEDQLKVAASIEPCHQQRAALIKSLLNFIKRAVQDTQFAESVPHIMDGELPNALSMIILRCDFFGASLFCNAVSLVTNFIYQEPSLLNSIQDKGLTDSILEAIFEKELPASREALSSLPNTFTALCLNDRGLEAFKAKNPFEHFFRILISTKFITAMKRRRNEMNFTAETAMGLGSTLDDLMRHQPSLRELMVTALLDMLNRLIKLASSQTQPPNRCVMSLSNCRISSNTASENSGIIPLSEAPGQDEDNMIICNDTSDDEDDDPASAPNIEEVPVTASNPNTEPDELGLADSVMVNGTVYTPLGEHLINVGKFLETLVIHNASTDSAQLFVTRGVAKRLIALLFVKHIPLEISQSFFPQLVSNIARYLYQQTRDVGLIAYTADQLHEHAAPLFRAKHHNLTTESIFATHNEEDAISSLCAVSSLCNLLSTISKMALANNSAVKNSIIKLWAEESLGLDVLSEVMELQRILIWEGAVLSEFNASNMVVAGMQTDVSDANDDTSDIPRLQVERAPDEVDVSLDSDDALTPNAPLQKLSFPEDNWVRTKTANLAMSRCQRQVTELITVLSKMCIGASTRYRRAEEANSPSTTLNYKATLLIANKIFKIYHRGLKWVPTTNTNAGVKIVYLTNVITTITDLMFDERNQPYLVLLSEFYATGCHDAFFTMMADYLSNSFHDSYPGETEELLQAWLTLTQRLLNAEQLRHTRYRVSDQYAEIQHFDVAKYLAVVQRDAFSHLRSVFNIVLSPAWSKTKTKTIDLTLSVYKELTRGLISASNVPMQQASEERRSFLSEVDETNLLVLMDMGFSREAAVDALLEYSTVSEAAEYLIANGAVNQQRQQSHVRSGDDSPVLDEQRDQSGNKQQNKNTNKPGNELSTAAASLSLIASLDLEVVIEALCTEIVPKTMLVIEDNKDLVFGAAELLAVLLEAVNPKESDWCRDVLIGEFLKKDIDDLVETVTKDPEDEKKIQALSTRLHLACLLWESTFELYLDEGRYLCNRLLQLLEKIATIRSQPLNSLLKLVAPACFWIDLYSKMLHMVCSKDKVESAMDSMFWKYWDTDDRGGPMSWISHSPILSHKLTTAFILGKRTTTIILNGVEHKIDFANMTQRNLETNAERQITVIGHPKPDAVISETVEPASEVVELNQELLDRAVPHLIALLRLPNLDTYAIFAILALLARITRSSEIAREVLYQGGIHAVLGIVGPPHSITFHPVSLIVRHCLDDETSISQIFEKTIRTVAAGGYLSQPRSRWHHARPPRSSREWLHAMRAVAPLCARHPRLFVATMERVARIEKGQISSADVNNTESSFKTANNSSHVKQVVEQLMNHTLDFSWNDAERVTTRCQLIRLIAELVKSYSTVAILVAESQESSGHSALVTLINRCLVPPAGVIPANHPFIAVKNLVVSLASCNHSPKAQESLVSDVISCLHLVYAEADQSIVNSKVKALAELLLLMRDACPTSHDPRHGTSANTHPNSIIRLFVKKRVCIELARAPWHLNLSTKEGIETLNGVIKTMEEITRSVNSAQNSGASSSHGAQGFPRPYASTSLTVSVPSNIADISAISSPSVDRTEEESHISDVRSGQQENPEIHGEDFMEEEEMDHSILNNARTGPDPESSDSDDEDDEDDDGDDDDDPRENVDMEDESDEEERDEAVMEEEGRGSEEEEEDEEGDYGMVDVGEPGGRFEDGETDENFDPSLYLENIDNVTGEVLTPAINGPENMRSQRPLISAPLAHPLMQRPLPILLTEGMTSSQRPPQAFRSIIGPRRGFGTAAPGLHRQGAVRRWVTLSSQSEIIERLIENNSVTGGNNVFDVAPSRQRLFNIIMQEGVGEDMVQESSSEDRRPTLVPNPLGRFFDAASFFDGQAMYYIWVAAAAYVTSTLEAIEKHEAEEKEAARKKELESSKEYSAEENQVASTANTTGLDDITRLSPRALSPGDEEILSEQQEPSSSRPHGEDHSSMYVLVGSPHIREDAQSVAEPMDVSDGEFNAANMGEMQVGTAPLERDTNADVEGDDGSADVSMNATQLSDEISAITQTSAPDSSDVVAEDGATQTSPSPGVSDGIRALLGDIEIPDGVDPEFLAALPEDIRVEVINDHMRQQRAQRLTQPVSSDTGGEVGAANGGTAGVEPLDQEFLNALPPELQEEVLAQHERALRLANGRPDNSEGVGAAGTSTDSDDAAALIESLPPGLRASVLADADDTVLQILPQSIAAEARRLRANYEQQQVMRFARMLAPTRYRPGNARDGGSSGSGNTPLGALAGSTTLASFQGNPLLDRDTIVTLIILLFVDPVRLNTQRLQKLIKSICAQSAACDFVVWCLIALLEKLDINSTRYEEFSSSVLGWIDHICVSSGIGQHEHAIKFLKSPQNVAIHPSVSVVVTRLVLETLISLAKTYPGHFLPAKLRTPPPNLTPGSQPFALACSSTTYPTGHFWHIVHGISKAEAASRGSSHRNHFGSSSGDTSVGLSTICATSSLEDCPLGILMKHFERPVIMKSPQLLDKLLRLICTIMQTLPDDTASKMELDEEAEIPPLAEQLKLVVMVLTEGECSEEGMSDGRTLLMEAIRSLTKAMRTHLNKLLISAAQQLGGRLLSQIVELYSQLEKLPDEMPQSFSGRFPVSTEIQPHGRRVTVNRYDDTTVVIEGVANSRAVLNASGCIELQLPAMRALTDKHGVQNVFLRTLQTIVKVREMQKAGTRRKADIPESKSEEDQDMERLSVLLQSLQPLWEVLSTCLTRLAKTDAHAALALQPAAEAFFLVHASALSEVDPNKPIEHPDAAKLFRFAEKHRGVLNQVLRQSGTSLSDGPFAILIRLPKILDFDVKRNFFRKQMQKLDERVRSEDVAVRVRRNNIFSDSFRELYRLRGPEWKARFYIIFENEEGQDAGGLLREWFSIITREVFNPDYALFITAPGDRVTYMINKSSYVNPEHLDYFKFIGRVIAKAVYENKLLDCYFTRAFYKHILSIPVRAQDMESEDPEYYKSLQFMLNNPIEEVGTDFTFSIEVEEFGVRQMRQLKEDGASITVTDENKEEYVKLVCQMKMTGSIKQQLASFLEGFYDIIPKQLISIFNEQELELLISGLPSIDIDDLYANTEYKTYTKTSPQIQWFWKALRSFEQEDRAKFLQFVTGTSKVPLQGFAALEGMNGIQRFSIHMDSRSPDRLPTAHTCFNQLDLPQYESYEKLQHMLLLAVRECTEGFGFA